MVGEELGNYRVIAPLGKGGMASVYVGEHKVLGHKVAIKILHPKHLSNESIERRFFNEAKAIASIKHQSVVELFDFGRADDGRAYIVMELLEGESLRARIRSGIMDQAASAVFARQIASGLAKAHERGIVHRDLKPDNVFLVRDPEVALGERAKVLDFGIAKQTDFGGPVSEHTATGILVGTPAYMSPEQCRGTGTVDARSDIYSLGVVLYRMVTNQLPFEASGTGELIGKHLYVDPRSAKELNPLICDEMGAVIQKCLSKDPADRYQSMTEVADALKAAHKTIREAESSTVTPSPLPGALAAQPGQSFNAPAVAAPASNPPASATPASNPAISGTGPHSVPPEDLATEIQVTPSPMHLSSAVVPAPPPPAHVPEEETSPTTLRHATGEAARVDYGIANSNRRVAMIAAGVIAAVAAVALAVSGEGEQGAGASPAVERSAGQGSDDPTERGDIGAVVDDSAGRADVADPDDVENQPGDAEDQPAGAVADSAEKPAADAQADEAHDKAETRAEVEARRAKALAAAKAKAEAKVRAEREKKQAKARAEAKKLAEQQAAAEKARREKAKRERLRRDRPKKDKKDKPKKKRGKKDDKKFETRPVF